MKCAGVKDNSRCLNCKYSDCITDVFGNLPEYEVRKIMLNRQRCREYYARHREERLAKYKTPEERKKRYGYVLKWRANNHERMLEQQKRYHAKHREELKKKHAEYYQAHKEEIKAKNRENYRRKRDEQGRSAERSPDTVEG